MPATAIHQDITAVNPQASCVANDRHKKIQLLGKIRQVPAHLVTHLPSLMLHQAKHLDNPEHICQTSSSYHAVPWNRNLLAAPRTQLGLQHSVRQHSWRAAPVMSSSKGTGEGRNFNPFRDRKKEVRQLQPSWSLLNHGHAPDIELNVAALTCTGCCQEGPAGDVPGQAGPAGGV